MMFTTRQVQHIPQERSGGLYGFRTQVYGMSLILPDFTHALPSYNAVTSSGKSVSSQLSLKPPGAIAFAGSLVCCFDGNLQAFILLGTM